MAVISVLEVVTISSIRVGCLLLRHSIAVIVEVVDFSGLEPVLPTVSGISFFWILSIVADHNVENDVLLIINHFHALL